MIVEAKIASAFISIAASTSFSTGTEVPRYSTMIPYFSIPPCLMSMISLSPTECSSSPTVAPTIFIGWSWMNSLISSSDITSGSSGMTRSLTSTVKPTLPFSSTLVPSAACITSIEITSGSSRFIFFANSSAANSATLLDAGRNIVNRIVPSPIHSTSGLIWLVFLRYSVSFILRFTLSFSSSSSM